jgi:hypothetical protein
MLPGTLARAGAAVAGAVVAAALAAVAPASAATFYVDAGSSAPGACTSPANACTTIGAAVTKARGASGPDTIVIAPGVYEESLNLSQPADAGLALVGAGAGPSGTVLRPPASTVVTGGATLAADGQSLSGVRIEMREGAEKLRPLFIYASDVAVSDVQIAADEPGNGEIAITVERGNAVLSGVEVDGTWAGRALFVSSSSLGAIVRDSDLRSNALTTVAAFRQPLTLERTTVASARADAIGVAIESAPLTVDSSLITGGAIGVQVTEGGASVRTHVVRDSTIDVGAAGVADAGGAAGRVQVYGEAHATLRFEGSLLVEPQATPWVEAGKTGVGQVECAASDVRDQVASTSGGRAVIACGAGSEENTSSPPETLFAGGPAGSYDHRPAPGGPAVDTGRAGPDGGEQALGGTPRAVDGDGDCDARRDRGAYELTGHEGTPPANLAIDVTGAAVAGGPPVGFAGSAEDDDAPLTWAWSFGDGGTATGQSAEHAFAAAGPHDVELTVTDAAGCVSRLVRQVDVADPVVEDDGAGPGAGAGDGGSGGSGAGTGTGGGGGAGHGAAGAAGSGAGASQGGGGGGATVTPAPGTRRGAASVRDAAAPVVRRLTLSPRRLRTRGRRSGGSLALRLSEAATVTITVERRRTCPRGREGRRCTPWRAAGTLRRAAKAGTTTLRFTGRLNGRALPAGRYRLVVVATDAAGNRSRPKTLGFTVVR